MILKRKQRWRLSIPLINREGNFIAETKSKNWNCETKKCLKEEKEKEKKLKNEKQKEKVVDDEMRRVISEEEKLNRI